MFITTTSISSMSNNRIDFNDGKGDFKQNVKNSTQGPMSSQAPCIRDSSQPDNHAPPYSFSSGDEDSDDEVVENGSGSKAKSYADDDEFFDADEGSYSERATIVSQETSDSKTSNKKLLSKHMRSMSIQSSITSDDFFMPEEDNSIDEEEVDMGKQPVIRYLISQVRIGMDLTRIPLPTFILESRSLLEMYSAFFAHPDIFCCIADKTSPRERFMQVVKWYLSSLHAGRKSNVAKKPYNPILGEQFHCLFDPRDGGSSSEYKTSSMDPNNNKHGENGKPVVDDQSIPLPNQAETQKSEQPLPWATKHHVQFSAEQVSHHPPISAFYAENIEKNIQFNAQIWTKSKFLGLSICVHNIGQGVISLSGGAGKGEEYVVTFPSGYGRSILSIPWIELGGQCEIRCAKTGYTATVDFHTKPFYGGKLHRTTTKVYSPSDKRTASVVLEGEWNGSIKYTSGGPPKGVFIDTQNIPIYRKYVRRMEKQQNHESRKMWSRVTNALATNNIDEASDGKNALEEKQRADRGHREENGITWENKLFTKVDDLWIFKNSLSKRLDDAEKSDK